MSTITFDSIPDNNQALSEDPSPASFQGRRIEELLPQEESFSSQQYICIAFGVAAIATVTFPICFPLSMTLFAIATWHLWSASIVEIDRAAVDTRFASLVHRLYEFTTEMNSGFALLSTFPSTFFDHAPQEHLDGKPIVLINGYLGYGRSWFFFRQKLIDAGFGPIYTIDLGSLKSIETYAGYVQDQVKEIPADIKAKGLTLIGHSRGGLIAAYYATHLANKEEGTQVDRVITIGSPFEGTWGARFSPGKDAEQMTPESQFHVLLREEMRKCETTEFFYIASKADVTVPTGAVPAWADSSHQCTFDNLGHKALLCSSRVAACVGHFLTAEQVSIQKEPI